MLTIAVDTREQTPWSWSPEEVGTIRVALSSGDYAPVIDGEVRDDLCAVERKSLGDLAGCIGRERPRFERELQRLHEACTHPYLVIEATVEDITEHRYEGQVAPAAILGSVLAWSIDYGIRPIFAGTWALAGRLCLRLFRAVHRRVEREAAVDIFA